MTNSANDYGLDLGYFPGARQAIEHIPAILGKDERILAAATGFLEGRTGLVAATTDRFLFIYRDQTPINASYSDISSFRARTGIVTADIEVVDETGKATIKQIHPRSRLPELARLLHDGPGDASTNQAVPPSLTRDSSGADASAWRPKLRPKISPLPPRPEVGSQSTDASSSPLQRETGGARSTPLLEHVLPTEEGGWSPQFMESTTLPGDARHAIPEPRFRSSSGRREQPTQAPQGWLGTGEWLISVFPVSEATVAGRHFSSVEGAVTNLRVLLRATTGESIGTWDLAEVTPGTEDRPDVALTEGGAQLRFVSENVSREFGAAVTAALNMRRPRSAGGTGKP